MGQMIRLYSGDTQPTRLPTTTACHPFSAVATYGQVVPGASWVMRPYVSCLLYTSLMLLYPLAITLILLGLTGKWFGHDPLVYRLVTGLTLVTAIFDFLGALPAQASSPQLNAIVGFAKDFLPLYGLGLGWVCPAALGLAIGLALRLVRIKKAAR